MKTDTLPAEVIEQNRKAGRARMAAMTPAERSALGRLSWQRRIEKARKAAGLVTSARTMPE